MTQPPTAPPDQRRDAAARSAYYYQQQPQYQHQAPVGSTPTPPSLSGMTPVAPSPASTSTIINDDTTTTTSTAAAAAAAAAAARVQYHAAPPPGAVPQQTLPHPQLQSLPTPPDPVSIVPHHQPVGGAPPHPSPLQHPPPPPPQQQQHQQHQRMHPPQQQQRQPPRRQPPREPGRGALQDDSLRSLMLRLDRQGQQLLDRVAPYKLYRWVSLVVILLLFLLRMFVLEGFYIVAYVLFIFILNQFILFLQPKDRAALVARAVSSSSSSDQSDQQQTQNPNQPNGGQQQQQQQKDESSASDLPTTSFEGDEDEFRPFVRRLPEFKFWYSTTYATILAICATFVKAFDVPVFWPLLLFYFIMLFVATMRRQWLDMKRLKYVPWDIGTKKVYKSDPKSVSVSSQQQHHHAARKPSSSSVATAAGGPASVVNASTRPPAPVPTIQVVKKPSSTSD